MPNLTQTKNVSLAVGESIECIQEVIHDNRTLSTMVSDSL